MGLPFNDTLRLLRSDNDTDSLNGTPILSYAAYPLVAVVHYKISTLRNLLTIPFRLLTLPVDVARAVWRTKEALQRPVDATMLGQLHDDLHKLNATSLPKKDSS